MSTYRLGLLLTVALANILMLAWGFMVGVSWSWFYCGALLLILASAAAEVAEWNMPAWLQARWRAYAADKARR